MAWWTLILVAIGVLFVFVAAINGPATRAPVSLALLGAAFLAAGVWLIPAMVILLLQMLQL